MNKKVKLNLQKMPKHVAIIMDGNRRWAAKRGLGPVDGHRVAAEKAIEPIIDRAIELGVKFLTFWAFSTENWKRDKAELEGLFRIFRSFFQQRVDRLHQKGVRLRILGDITKFPGDIAEKVLEAVKLSAKNQKITVVFALNYGGRVELLEAVKKVLRDQIPPEELTEAVFASYLETVGMPDPDLIIRTGGEKRLSGFLPWQSVYAEFYFTPTLWPDFTPAKFDQALADYQQRERRFGGGKFAAYQRR